MVHGVSLGSSVARFSLWFALSWWAMPLSAQATATPAPAPANATVHGRIEVHDGLRLLRTWGTPKERGFAHGYLLADDIALSVRTEFAARFARKPGMLKLARQSLPRMIEYPSAIAAEIDALFDGLLASGVDLDMPELDRPIDVVDLRVANALDVFGLMGCSGFTVYGDDVDGGGVLSGRNFDWPVTGRHLVDQTLVMVQHGVSGRAVASVTWPGFVGTVTGVNEDGIAAYLHIGTGEITFTPEPSSWPTAIAARAILEEAPANDPKAAFALALDRLGYTSPPAGFLTRVVLPTAGANESPAGLFEADRDRVVRVEKGGLSIVTNHFQGRDDGRAASKDSLDRFEAVRQCLGDCLVAGDHKVSVAEAWTALSEVQRGGNKTFGTLHSLVFRFEPWCFELRLGDVSAEGKVIAAPVAERRHSLAREVLFAAPPAGRSSGG